MKTGRVCQKCRKRKKRSEFVLRKRGHWCNECRREVAIRSASRTLSDAYCISIILQGRPPREVSRDEIDEKRKHLMDVRIVRSAKRAAPFFRMTSAAMILCKRHQHQ